MSRYRRASISNPPCECGRLCGNCGEREADHPLPDCQEGWDWYTPSTHYVQLLGQTWWSPAEGVDVCDECGKER